MYVWVCEEFLEVREYIRLPEMGKVVGDAMKNVVKSELGVEFPLRRRGKVGHGGGMSSRSVHDKLIRDDHLHVLHPQASLKELVDRHIHAINDPGVTAEVVRFRSQTTRRA